MNPRRIFGLVFGVEAAIAGAVFLAICAAMLVAFWLSHRRRRAGRPATSRHENRPLEIAYALVVAAVVAFVVYLSLHTTNEEATAAEHPDVTVRVTGFQWCWRFDYPGHRVRVTGTCASQHHLPTMVVPVGQTIAIETTSSDVIHSWWVPGLRYKMDAFPNHINRFTIKIDRAGRWIGRCAEFCGESHYRMDFYLQAVSPSRYRQWLAAHHGSGLRA